MDKESAVYCRDCMSAYSILHSPSLDKSICCAFCGSIDIKQTDEDDNEENNDEED